MLDHGIFYNYVAPAIMVWIASMVLIAVVCMAIKWRPAWLAVPPIVGVLALWISTLFFTAVIVLAPVAAAFAAPHICLMDMKGDEMTIDRDRMNPIRGDVNPDGSVTYHFKDNNPPPITINGNEPMPFPVPGLNRVLQQHLHKKARHDYQMCLSREMEAKYSHHRHGATMHPQQGEKK